MKKLMLFALLLPNPTAFAMEAQKVATIHASTETLWSFLLKLPASFEAQVFYALFLSGALGSLASWVWKWSNGHASPNHYDLKYTFAQVLWLAGSAVAAIFTVGFSTPTGEFFGWLSVLWTGALAGFGGEVKNERPVWTSDQRAQNVVEPEVKT